MLRQSLYSFVQKVGLALSLTYIGILSFLHPIELVPYFPRFLININNETGFISLAGIIAVLLALWILSNRFKFYSNLTAAILIGITGLANITNLRFLFVTAPAFAIALSLTIRYYPRIRVITKPRNVTDDHSHEFAAPAIESEVEIPQHKPEENTSI